MLFATQTLTMMSTLVVNQNAYSTYETRVKINGP